MKEKKFRSFSRNKSGDEAVENKILSVLNLNRRLVLKVQKIDAE